MEGEGEHMKLMTVPPNVLGGPVGGILTLRCRETSQVNLSGLYAIVGGFPRSMRVLVM